MTSQFWLRKLHSITGGGFLALFLVGHIFYPGSNLFGRGFLVKLSLFSLPLLFHMMYGAVIIYETQWPRHPFLSNWRYLLQRITAIGIAIFLPFHVYVMSVQSAWIHSPSYVIVWGVGTMVTLYHLLNGLAGLLIHWGVTVGSRSQKVVLIALLAIGLALMIRAMAGIAELTGALSFLEPVNKLLF